MSDKIKELNVGSFKSFIEKGNSVVDFWAEWCGPCKVMGPAFDTAAKEIDEVNFGKVDVDTQTDIAQEYNIMGIPALLFFKDGELIDQTSGAMPSEDVIAKIKEVFKL